MDDLTLLGPERPGEHASGQRIEAVVAGPAVAQSVSLRVDCARARAASTNWGSFRVTSAWSGVLVRSRRTVQVSRVGALRMSSEAGGALRFQKV